MPSLSELATLPPGEVEQLTFGEVARIVEAHDVSAQPGALLRLAWASQPGGRRAERTEAIAQLAQAADPQLVRAAQAETAIDLARDMKLDEAEELCRLVLATCGPDEVITVARANDALGRVLAWRGDDASARAALALLSEVAVRYAQLGAREWQAFVLFWVANTVRLQRGELVAAEEGMREALQILAPDSPRRGTILTFFADVLTTLGRWDEVEILLEEAGRLGVLHGDRMTPAYVSWCHARVASQRGDAEGTVRHVLDIERHGGDWVDSRSGTVMLADAAELLDRVGERESADAYLARAVAREPDDPFVLQAQAALEARRGDPERALALLRRQAHVPWPEPRQAWRRTLLSAYATLRAGGDGVETLAVQAFAQAQLLGTAEVALIGEPALAAPLLPVAARAGSAPALALLVAADGYVIRVLGEAHLVHRGNEIPFPAGQPGRIVRLLSLHPQGLEADEVAEVIWPDLDPETARRRLRDALSRTRSAVGDLVVRTASRLSLAHAWVDAVAFREAADRALANRRPDLAFAALALWTGVPLPTDPYEDWAAGPREQLSRRRLALLDLVAAEATPEQAIGLLHQAIEQDPYDESRYVRIALHQAGLGRRAAALQSLRRGVEALAQLGLPPTPELVRAEQQLRT